MPYCVACKQECHVIKVDFGIGAYEFWGERGVHRDVQEVSSCCEEDWTYETPDEEEEDD